MRRVFLTVIVILSLWPLVCNAGVYSGGDGSEATPYLISDPNDWQELMSTSDDWGSHFRLTSDIDLTGIALTPIGNYFTVLLRKSW